MNITPLCLPLTSIQSSCDDRVKKLAWIAIRPTRSAVLTRNATDNSSHLLVWLWILVLRGPSMIVGGKYLSDSGLVFVKVNNERYENVGQP